MVLLQLKHNVEPEGKLILLEYSLLPAFLQQPSLRFPETALPGEAVVPEAGQRSPSTWSLRVQEMLPCPQPCKCSSWDLPLSAPELGPPVQFT